MGLNEDLEIVYKQFNRPAGSKFLKLAKAAGLQVTQKDINTFLSSKQAYQQLKETKKTKSQQGHIVAFNPFNLLQLDLYVMLKYEKHNKGYGYIMAILDVFSRKAWTYPIKNKSLKDTTAAIKQFFKEADIKSFNPDALTVIMSDSDGAFMGENREEGENFKKVLTDNNAVLEPIKLNDHSALGIIDVFAKNLKRILTQEFIDNGNTNWTEILPTIIKNYNNTPHSGLDGITPNEVFTDVNKRIKVLHLNMEKSHEHSSVSDLVKGDKVRIRETNIFKKGTEPRWSDEVYEVDSARGKSVELVGENKVLKRDQVLKVPNDTVSQKPNVIKVASKERQIKVKLKQAGVSEANVIPNDRGKREIKKRVILDL